MKVLITDQWDAYLERYPSHLRDVYYTEEYVKLYKDAEHLPLSVVCVDKDNVLLMPFLRGGIRNFYDFETPYGYGGPLSNTNDITWIHSALQAMNKCFEDNYYVCGFIRFHPLLGNANYCKDNMKVLFDRNTVTIDTSTSEDDIWMTQIKSKNRNMIRKAEKNGLEFRAEYDFASIGEFIMLYNNTMSRLDADKFYFFNEKYYETFISTLRGNGFLGTVRKDGKMICAALFMYSGQFGHYHLEGSDREYSSLGANNFLLWKAACEMNKLGIKKFHLGGGISQSHEDTLFKFKKAFSENLTDFFIGKEIFSISAYNELCDDWEQRNADKVELYGNRLLKYRY